MQRLKSFNLKVCNITARLSSHLSSIGQMLDNISNTRCITSIEFDVGKVGGFLRLCRFYGASDEEITSKGAAEMLGWLVYEQGIEPHVTVFDKSARQDGTFSRDDLPMIMTATSTTAQAARC